MKKFLILLFVLLSIHNSWSQHRDNQDQIKSLKIAHLTSELKLSSKEAEQFWPIYNTYSEKIYELRHNQTAKLIRETQSEDIERMSEKEADATLKKLESFELEYSNVRQTFSSDVKKILSNKKILKLKKAEDDFNRKLLKQYRGKK